MGWQTGRKFDPEHKEKIRQAHLRNSELARKARAMEVEERLAAAKAEAAAAERELTKLKRGAA